jgi:hypothetical protein
VPAQVVVVLDEAYGEFLDAGLQAPSVAWLAEFPNLVLTRTFSKAYGLAGLRVGYALASAEVAGLLNRVRQPFNVNSLALLAATAALNDANSSPNRNASTTPAWRRCCKVFRPWPRPYRLVRQFRLRQGRFSATPGGGGLPGPAQARRHRAPGRQLRHAGLPACQHRLARTQRAFLSVLGDILKESPVPA